MQLADAMLLSMTGLYLNGLASSAMTWTWWSNHWCLKARLTQETAVEGKVYVELICLTIPESIHLPELQVAIRQ